ncbi:DUF7255 family protein [Paeniglutamicibacter antarcticus]|uniref:Uncharacterized protein n=1 Tax=Paeniglutamicibacter antarcticus TaxID=494023 RepID=A0ABP9TQR7_9MICC
MGKISKAKLFESSLLNAGIPLRDTSKRGFKRATTAGLDKAQQQIFAQLFRDLGGLGESHGVFTAGDWDLADDHGMFLEFDEDTHFNRYRGQTLALPWSSQLPWTNDYQRYCVDFESKARVFGGYWTGEAAERQFGPASARRDFTANGGPRWKQRALYDAVRDAVALQTEGIGLIRVSIHDQIDGVPLGKLLKPGKLLAPQQLRKLIADRTIPLDKMGRAHSLVAMSLV